MSSICSVNLIMTSPNQMDHIFFNIFELNPEDEEDSNEEDLIFMSFLSDISSKHGIYTMSLFPKKIFAVQV